LQRNRFIDQQKSTDSLRVNPYIYIEQIYSKWILDLNIRSKTMKLLEENIGKICDFKLDRSFLQTVPKAQLDSFKISFCAQIVPSGRGCSSVVEPVASELEALDLVSSTIISRN
jgi:hypothetical protein